MSETNESVRVDKATRMARQEKERIDWRGKDFLQLVYADLYENNASGTNISITTAGTFYQWVSTTVGEHSGVNYLVASATSDDITVGVSGVGIYLITVHTCFGGSNNAVIEGRVYKNGATTHIMFHRKLAGSDIGSASACGLVALVSGDVIDLRFTSDTNTTTLVLHHVGLVLTRVSA